MTEDKPKIRSAENAAIASRSMPRPSKARASRGLLIHGHFRQRSRSRIVAGTRAVVNG